VRRVYRVGGTEVVACAMGAGLAGLVVGVQVPSHVVRFRMCRRAISSDLIGLMVRVVATWVGCVAVCWCVAGVLTRIECGVRPCCGWPRRAVATWSVVGVVQSAVVWPAVVGLLVLASVVGLVVSSVNRTATRVQCRVRRFYRVAGTEVAGFRLVMLAVG
jgi:hypothetical protein